MARYIAAGELTVGDQFIDPRQRGRCVVRVVKLLGVRNGEVFVELDDATAFGSWEPCYPETKQLELA